MSDLEALVVWKKSARLFGYITSSAIRGWRESPANRIANSATPRRMNRDGPRPPDACSPVAVVTAASLAFVCARLSLGPCVLLLGARTGARRERDATAHVHRVRPALRRASFGGKRRHQSVAGHALRPVLGPHPSLAREAEAERIAANQAFFARGALQQVVWALLRAGLLHLVPARVAFLVPARGRSDRERLAYPQLPLEAVGGSLAHEPVAHLGVVAAVVRSACATGRNVAAAFAVAPWEHRWIGLLAHGRGISERQRTAGR
jgi:hypothetical protein